MFAFLHFPFLSQLDRLAQPAINWLFLSGWVIWPNQLPNYYFYLFILLSSFLLSFLQTWVALLPFIFNPPLLFFSQLLSFFFFPRPGWAFLSFPPLFLLSSSSSRSGWASSLPSTFIISVLSMCVEEHGSSSVEFTQNHIKNQVGIIVFFFSFDKWQYHCFKCRIFVLRAIFILEGYLIKIFGFSKDYPWSYKEIWNPRQLFREGKKNLFCLIKAFLNIKAPVFLTSLNI